MAIVVGMAKQHARKSVSMLFFGRPRAGKTVLAASAQRVPELSPVFLVDADLGAASLRDQGLGDVITVTMTEARDLTAIYDFFATDQTNPAAMGLPANTPKFKTIILDSMTEIYRLCMEHARGTIGYKPGMAPEHTTRRDFGISLDMVLLIVRRFTQLTLKGYNVIFTARSKTITDEATGLTLQVAPALPGQAADEVGAYADIIGHLLYRRVSLTDKATGKSGSRILRVLSLMEPSTTAPTGSRYANIGKVVYEPTMEKLYKRLQEGPGEEVDESEEE